MEIYKLIANVFGPINTAERLSDKAVIPFAVGNTDYEKFKAQINADEAQLEDADDVLMTPEAAKAYVATLP